MEVCSEQSSRHGYVAHAEDWYFQGELNVLSWHGQRLRARRSSPLHFAALIASKCFLQPIAELPKHQAEISAWRFVEKFDDARAEVLPRFINRAG